MKWAGLLSLLVAFCAGAQAIVPDREIEIVRQNFNVGNYKEALTRARNAMEVSNFSDFQRGELHKYAGLSSFNLGDLPGAEKHFLSLLQINPDYVLDPFAYPPPVIRVFEEVKKKNADTLNLIRQQIALREEQARREAAEREKAKVLAEEQRRRLEGLSQQVTLKTIEKRSFVVNFIPFGAGQFQQGRTGFGIFLASFEGALAATSIVAYLALDALFENVTYSYEDRLYPADNKFSVTVRRIPEIRRNEANAWRIVKLSSGIGFYAVWALGVADAIWHHQDEVVTTENKRLDELSITPAPAAGPKLFLFPTSGGMGAGLNLRF